MGRFRGINDLLPRDEFVMTCGEELEKLDLLLSVELCSQCTARNQLLSKLAFRELKVNQISLHEIQSRTNKRDWPWSSRCSGSLQEAVDLSHPYP
jgi:hypothetical protein